MALETERQTSKTVFSMEEREPPTEVVTLARRFKMTGDNWDLMFEGMRFTVRDSKGMKYLQLLLQSPSREINALELSGTVSKRLIIRGTTLFLSHAPNAR